MRIFATTVPAFLPREKPISRNANPACMNITSTPATITHIVLIPTEGRASRRLRLLRSVASANAEPGTDAAAAAAPPRRREPRTFVSSDHTSLPAGRRDRRSRFQESRGTARTRAARDSYPACRNFGSGCLYRAVESPALRRDGASAARGPSSSSPPSMPISSWVASPPSRSQRGARVRAEAVEELVGVQRVVVEEQQPAGLDPAGEGERVGDRRVPPADVVGVLLVGVLAVVDQQVGVAGEVEARDPLRLELVERRAERRLVVGDVGERRVAVGDPVAERRPAVGDGLGADRRAAELPLGRRGVAEGDRAGKLADLDRRQRGGDVAGDAVLERGLGRGRAPRS